MIGHQSFGHYFNQFSHIGQIIDHFSSRTYSTNPSCHPTNVFHCHGKISLVGLHRLNRYKPSKNPQATATQWSKFGVYSSVAIASNAACRLGCGCRI